MVVCIFSVHAASAFTAEKMACGGKGDPTCEAMAVAGRFADISGDEISVQLVQKKTMAKRLQTLRQAGTWLLGAEGQSCSDACAAISSSCQQKDFAMAARAAAGAPESVFGAVATDADLACKDYSGAYGDAADIPARWSSGTCAKGSETRSDASAKCDQAPGGTTRRFCFCGSYIVPTLSTSTGGTWILGDVLQSCSDACAASGSSCKQPDFSQAARVAANIPETVFGALGTTSSLACKDYSSAYGDAADIPSRWNSGTCAKGSAVRSDDSLKCDQTPGGATRRFCYCGNYNTPVLPTLTGGNWLLGDISQSCTDACAMTESSCKQLDYVQAARAAAGTPEAVFGALGTNVGLTCKDYSTAYGTASDIPARWDSGTCAQGSAARSDDSLDCDKTPGGGTRRFCYCGVYFEKAATQITEDTSVGAKNITVANTSGFAVGDTVMIKSAAGAEQAEVTGFPSIEVKSPLQYAHPSGTTLRKTKGWYMSGVNKTCGEGCAAAGLLCFESNQAAHNMEVDSSVKLKLQIEQLGGSTTDDYCLGTQSSNPDVPSFEATYCFFSSSSRSSSSFDCDQAPVGGVGKQRLCYCAESEETVTTTAAP